MYATFGVVSVGARQHLVDLRTPGVGERARVDADTRRADGPIDVVGEEHLAGVSPQLIDRFLRAGPAFVGTVAERDDPLCAVAHVIPRFLHGLRRDTGELGVDALPSASICRSENTLKKN